jgi:hypothetical protein
MIASERSVRDEIRFFKRPGLFFNRVGAFAAGAPAGLGRGDLEPHRDLVLVGSTGYLWKT